VSWAVRWEQAAQDTLRGLARRDAALARRIRQRVAAYAASSQGDVKKLRGSRDQWRLRVGDWRVIYVYDPPGFITVIDVVLRRDAYRD
jgi:mRNA-degrading endonuclease RelE of RelBE toxin-antitoxin system